jgi:hypothetical protein
VNSFCAECVSEVGPFTEEWRDGKKITICARCSDWDPRKTMRRVVERGYNPGTSVGGISQKVRSRNKLPRVGPTVGRKVQARGTTLHRVQVRGPNGEMRDAVEALDSVAGQAWTADAVHLGTVMGPDGELVHLFDSKTAPKRFGRRSEIGATDKDEVLSPEVTRSTSEEDQQAIYGVVEDAWFRKAAR